MLVVASSDLSHYDPYDMAVEHDHTTIGHILEGEGDKLGGDDACGLCRSGRSSPWHAYVAGGPVSSTTGILVTLQGTSPPSSDMRRLVSGRTGMGMNEH